ncbi:MAG: MFS transporter [Actinobacteria bacterium]|nr:MFS transporter [Actinomycetota bacterium]
MSSEPAPFIPASSEATPIPPAPWRLFGTRPFFKLWLAQVFSSLGDWVGLFAILIITARVSDNSAVALSLVMAARMVPGFFLATIGGVIVDRFDRRKVMVVCDVGRAGIISLLPFVNTLGVLIAVSFCIEMLTLLWGPAKDASVPHFVQEENLARANTLSLAASYGTFPVGALIFSVLAVVATWLGGFDALSSLLVDREVIALWFDAVTYVVSAIIVLGLPIAGPDRGLRRKLEWMSTFSEIKEGFAFIRHDRFTRAVIVGLGGGIIGAGAMVPLGAVFAREILGSDAQFGVLLMALGVGASIGLLSLLAFQSRLPKDAVFAWAVMGVGVFLALAAAANVGGLAGLMIAAVGACAGSAYVTGFTLIQETVSDELRGRTFATLYTVVRLCLLLSLTVAPLSADLYEWLFGLVDSDRHITFGGFDYGFPGVRWALWAGAGITVLSGLYARHELRTLRVQIAAEGHPSAAAAPPGDDPTQPSEEEAQAPSVDPGLDGGRRSRPSEESL